MRRGDAFLKAVQTSVVDPIARAMNTTIRAQLADYTIPSIAYYGSTASTAAAAASLTASYVNAIGKLRYVQDDTSVGATPPTNLGTQFIGRKALYWQPSAPNGGGNRVINLPSRTDATAGQEFLAPFITALKAGTTVHVGLVGNSTMGVGFFGGRLAELLASFPNVVIHDYSISGTLFEEWRTNTVGYVGSGKALADVLAGTALQLLIVGFGHNEPNAGTAADVFGTQMDAGFTTVRATWTKQQCAIMVVSPNTMNLNLRSQLAVHQQIPVLRQRAINFDCAYFGAYELFPDAYVDTATGPLHGIWSLDGVHPGVALRDSLAWEAYKFVVPEGCRTCYGSATYDPPSLALAASSTIQTLTVTGALLGDFVRASFSLDLAGAEIKAWVSAADTVHYYFTNTNGTNPLNLASGTVRIVAGRI